MATYRSDLLDAIEGQSTKSYTGDVWRHMFNDYAPERPNESGARWNPRGTSAIYTSCKRDTAIAEGQHAMDVQPRRLVARRRIYQLHVEVERVLDLTQESQLSALGLSMADVESDDLRTCQEVGGAAAWLDLGGLLIPSARAAGPNLVIFIDNADPAAAYERRGEQDLPVA